MSSAYQLPQGCTNGNVAKWNGSAWSCATDSDTTAVGGDLSGSQTSATVTKLQGRAVASSAPASGQVLKYDGSQWVPGADSTTHYQNVVVVSKSGGDFTSISAALGSISDASASNPYLIFVAPGVYTEQVTMKPYVDIQGAGETATKITYPGNYDRGTVAGANNTELRFLTVESTAGFGSIAISNSGTAPRLTHITANASGLGGTDRVIGLYNIAGSAPILTNVSISATGPASTGDFDVWNINSSITMMNVTASASGSGEYNVGVVNEASQAIINNSTICSPVTGGGVSNFGIYNYMEGVSYIIQVNNSQISGVYPFYNVSGPIVHVAASQLNGGAVYGGTMICAGVYDENYTFFAGPACP